MITGRAEAGWAKISMLFGHEKSVCPWQAFVAVPLILLSSSFVGNNESADRMLPLKVRGSAVVRTGLCMLPCQNRASFAEAELAQILIASKGMGQILRNMSDRNQL